MAYNDLGYIAADSPILSQIDEAAKRYGVDRNLAHAVAQMESNYNPKADSGKAQGVMQLTPDTARYLGVKNVWDSKENIDAGMRYLRDLDKQFGGKRDLVLAAYNAGPGRVDQYKGVPPFPETQNYVKRGTTLLAQAQPAANYDDLGYISATTAPQPTAAPVRHPMPEPPGAPKIAVEPVPVPPGFGQRVYQQTLQGPVELATGLWNDPKGTLMKTLASMTATQIQAARNPLQVQQGLATPIIEDVRSGNLPGLAGGVTGLALDVFAPKILSKAPGVIKATPTAVKGAAQGAYKAGTARRTFGEAGLSLGVGVIGGPQAAAATQTALTGTRIGIGALRGAREALKARAAAAAETLAAERAAAAQPGPSPLIPEERRLNAPLPPPDTSYVRAVPAEPLPPSRQLPAPGRPAIITPEPEAPPDTSFVRSVDAVYGSPAVNEAAVGMREAMGLQPGQFAPPAGRTAPIAARASQIDQMARHMRQGGITATDAALLDPPELAALAQAAGIEGSLGKVAVAVRKRLAAMEKAEAETAKYQAAWDKLKPAEKAAVTGESEAPAVERKPPAGETALPTTAEEANVELGKSLSVEMPAEKPPALTAPEKRIEAVAQAVAADRRIPLAQIEDPAVQAIFFEKVAQGIGEARPGQGEPARIFARIRELRKAK